MPQSAQPHHVGCCTSGFHKVAVYELPAPRPTGLEFRTVLMTKYELEGPICPAS